MTCFLQNLFFSVFFNQTRIVTKNFVIWEWISVTTYCILSSKPTTPRCGRTYMNTSDFYSLLVTFDPSCLTWTMFPFKAVHSELLQFESMSIFSRPRRFICAIGLVVKSIVAIDGPRVRFSDRATSSLDVDWPYVWAVGNYIVRQCGMILCDVIILFFMRDSLKHLSPNSDMVIGGHPMSALLYSKVAAPTLCWLAAFLPP